MPSVAEEDDRRLHRERGRLINERIQHVNRIKGLLAIHGIYDYQPLRRDRMQQLERLRTADGRTLPPRLKAEILRELQRLELVIGMIKAIEAERDAIASAKAQTEHTSAKKMQDLAKIKCIGPEFAPDGPHQGSRLTFRKKSKSVLVIARQHSGIVRHAANDDDAERRCEPAGARRRERPLDRRRWN